jgi:DNA-binding transcriptional LysR family regulator
MGPLRPALERLRLRDLHLLDVLAREGSLRKAAEQLHVSQPAVSRMVREIESAFGGALFLRTRRGVVANARLRALLRRSRVALGEVRTAAEELRGATAVRPVLRIGANLHLLTHLLPQVIARLHAGDPALRFALSEGSSTRLVESLLAGDLDCVVGRPFAEPGRTPFARDLAFWPVCAGRLCVVANPRHRLARRRRLSFADLAGEAWALSAARGQSRELLSQAFLRAGFPPPEPLIECRPFHANLGIAAEMPLLTVAMYAEARRAQSRGLVRILPIDLGVGMPPIAFVCRALSAADPLIAAVREAVLAAGRALDRLEFPDVRRRARIGVCGHI